MKRNCMLLFVLLLSYTFSCAQPPAISVSVNQVAYNTDAPKQAVIRVNTKMNDIRCILTDSLYQAVGLPAVMLAAEGLDWSPKQYYYRCDFSAVNTAGRYRIGVLHGRDTTWSASFMIGENVLTKQTLPSIIHYYFKQRANTPQEQEADRHVKLFGSNDTVDIRGGWCDASGDISKYFSHLAYTNFMLPQQTPLVTWSMIQAREKMQQSLQQTGSTAALEAEALWGADYIMRSLSPKGYFYMTVFSYFKPDPNERRIVGLLANSVTTSDYQCAYREGGGMAIAALARISQWKKDGEYSSAQYLAAAKRAFAHLEQNNMLYTDDGKENILDDYCALMAATELWIATSDTVYRNAARKRAANLCRRISPTGFFIANENNRPFWHAADAGMPVIALIRYVDKEENADLKNKAIQTIARYLDYQLRVTGKEYNVYGYARQSFLYKNQLKEGFFIPHENESGWWWQGENARLASLATAAIAGARIAFAGDIKKQQQLRQFAWNQLSWILGCNPYDMCFMYGFGQNNVPHMSSMFGHGSEKGGISNGITGKDGAGDGSGIDFRKEAGGNEWRWTEQWIPHAAWFLQALTALEN